MTRQSKEFYDREYLGDRYSNAQKPEEHSFYTDLKFFINKYELHKKRCLEIGCGRGVFQDLVPDYVGVDITDSVQRYFHKPFFKASVTTMGEVKMAVGRRGTKITLSDSDLIVTDLFGKGFIVHIVTGIIVSGIKLKS